MDPPTGPSLGPYDYDLLVIGGGSGGLAVAKVNSIIILFWFTLTALIVSCLYFP